MYCHYVIYHFGRFLAELLGPVLNHDEKPKSTMLKSEYDSYDAENLKSYLLLCRSFPLRTLEIQRIYGFLSSVAGFTFRI